LSLLWLRLGVAATPRWLAAAATTVTTRVVNFH
jgi:hypothetical protein